MERLCREQEGLKKEVVKAISGESDFDRSLLKTLLDENKVAQQETEEALQQAIHDNAFEEEQVKKLEYHFRSVIDWAEQFDHVPVDTQKMILARLIERIDVRKGYQVAIKFFVSLEDFFGTSLENAESA
jgi:uncharacterized protein Smg (DUF494 family)